MSTALKIWKKILPFAKNKFILTILIFIIWILFFDRNNLIDRAKELRHLRQLENDKKYYIERIDKDSKRLEQLKTNNKNLEKFAREQYLMKKENEDIFVIVEED
ncbi:MAG: septum formation inhibitor [Bacteroidales bacterium]|nr:septum formation inhibitor [Bacteroidales bacterium]